MNRPGFQKNFTPHRRIKDNKKKDMAYWKKVEATCIKTKAYCEENKYQLIMGISGLAKLPSVG